MTILTLTRPAIDFAPLSVTARAIRSFARGFGRALASIAASQRAAAEYRRLQARSEPQLGIAGLTRVDAARLVFERHFS